MILRESAREGPASVSKEGRRKGPPPPTTPPPGRRCHAGQSSGAAAIVDAEPAAGSPPRQSGGGFFEGFFVSTPPVALRNEPTGDAALIPESRGGGRELGDGGGVAGGLVAEGNERGGE